MSSRIVHGASPLVEAVPWRRFVDENAAPAEPPPDPSDLDASASGEPEPPTPAVDPCEPLREHIAALGRQLAAAAEAAAGRERRALEQGRAAGLAEGREEGAAAVRAEAAAAIEATRAESADRAAQAGAQAVDLRKRLRQQMEADLVKLAIAVARRILRRELAVDPDALLGIVKSAVERISARELLAIRVAPSDGARVRARLAEFRLPERVEVIEDAGLAWGSVVLDTTRGHHDASVETQIEEIDRGLADLAGRPAA